MHRQNARGLPLFSPAAPLSFTPLGRFTIRRQGKRSARSILDAKARRPKANQEQHQAPPAIFAVFAPFAVFALNNDDAPPLAAVILLPLATYRILRKILRNLVRFFARFAISIRGRALRARLRAHQATLYHR